MHHHHHHHDHHHHNQNWHHHHHPPTLSEDPSYRSTCLSTGSTGWRTTRTHTGEMAPRIPAQFWSILSFVSFLQLFHCLNHLFGGRLLVFCLVTPIFFFLRHLQIYCRLSFFQPFHRPAGQCHPHRWRALSCGWGHKHPRSCSCLDTFWVLVLMKIKKYLLKPETIQSAASQGLSLEQGSSSSGFFPLHSPSSSTSIPPSSVFL